MKKRIVLPVFSLTLLIFFLSYVSAFSSCCCINNGGGISCTQTAEDSFCGEPAFFSLSNLNGIECLSGTYYTGFFTNGCGGYGEGCWAKSCRTYDTGSCGGVCFQRENQKCCSDKSGLICNEGQYCCDSDSDGATDTCSDSPYCVSLDGCSSKSYGDICELNGQAGICCSNACTSGTECPPKCNNEEKGNLTSVSITHTTRFSEFNNTIINNIKSSLVKTISSFQRTFFDFNDEFVCDKDNCKRRIFYTGKGTKEFFKDNLVGIMETIRTEIKKVEHFGEDYSYLPIIKTGKIEVVGDDYPFIFTTEQNKIAEEYFNRRVDMEVKLILNAFFEEESIKNYKIPTANIKYDYTLAEKRNILLMDRFISDINRAKEFGLPLPAPYYVKSAAVNYKITIDKPDDVQVTASIDYSKICEDKI